MPMLFEEDTLRDLLQGNESCPGLYEQLLGFRVSTKSIKGVHVMNDLAQTLLGGAPNHGGDLICRVIREERTLDGEDNSDAAIRADPRLGTWYRRAFPADLDPTARSRLRHALGTVFNHDGGVYRASDNMASGLATSRLLLGYEGFRRFRVGRFLKELLGHEGQKRFVSLFEDEADPISQLFAPLLVEVPLEDKVPAPGIRRELSEFEEAAGRRLTQLVGHHLSKPTLLRALLLGSSLLLTLKVLGVGRQNGRPAVLATFSPDQREPSGLRQVAVQTFRAGMDALYAAAARALPSHPLAGKLWDARPNTRSSVISIPESPDSLDAAAPAIIQAARRHAWGGGEQYSPEEFVVALGRKIGCVQPRKDQAGGGKRLALTPDLIEVLVLMYSSPEGSTRPWAEIWSDIRAELGLVVGVNEHQDAMLLERARVTLLNMEELAANGDRVLEAAARRGVAHHLPDHGAEAGAALQ